MINNYTKKVLIVDDNFMNELKVSSQTDFNKFNESQLDTEVVILPVANEKLDSLIKVTNPSNIKPGEILVKGDYSNQFNTIDSFAEDSTLKKYRIWVNLCVALGAKSITIKNIENLKSAKSNNDSIKLDIKAEQAMTAKASVKFKSENNNYFDGVESKIMNMNIIASGCEPDFDAANKIMQRYNLFHDDMFTSILELRELTFNPISKHEFELDFSKDFNQVFDSTLNAQLDLMCKFAKGKTSLEKVRNSYEEIKSAIKVNVIVEF
ncbi:hypothetical protein CWC02_06110 [Pseudoalteromonas sp. S2721]|uniref:hypothetical protein n=1 Tax=Pseudoalteromonas sp. S2721 TaxID=579526 RepID=UPI00110B7FEB|nr:hypothetical protein [Pseudoalteromonas sp. S2721]TMP20418.1 hypothetical protein CWC02_06110 [Pseudoalteromonas sp. S2721]